MSTPTWGIPAICLGEGGARRCGAVVLVLGVAGLDRRRAAGHRRVGQLAPGHRRRAPGTTSAPPQQRPCLRLHHLDAGPRVFRLDQLIHPLRAARMQPKHRPI